MLPETLDRLYNLNVGIIGRGVDRHERPHKPTMLLAVLDLIASGEEELIRLAREPVLPPRDLAYYPAAEALEWRAGRLRA